ncbi:MAG: YqgE/AlgH family protein [Tannerella sp.]|jgi:putative transcriptional regulator|nr:YqgE/AlgH family protein [Tannerella sp.]
MEQYGNIFEVRHNGLRPQKGSILISEPFLRGVHFQHAVVLLVEHNMHGSMGLVLNKRTELRVNDLFPELKSLPDIPVYLGGPVGANHLYFLHTLGGRVPGSMPIEGDLCFDGDFEVIKSYILDRNPVEGHVKFFLGYSGWTENQLNGEILGDSWLVSTPTAGRIMCDGGDALWKDAVRSLGSPYDTWTNYPVYPDMN